MNTPPSKDRWTPGAVFSMVVVCTIILLVAVPLGAFLTRLALGL